MKKVLSVFLVCLLAVALTACGSTASGEKASGSAKKSETITVKHELGTTKVPKNPKNVVVFDFGALETLDKLGVPVKGVAKGSALPSYLSKYKDSKYANVGGLKDPDFEKINALKPGLIIISGRQSSAYKELSKIAPTIYVGIDDAHYMDSFTKNAETLGKIFGKEDEVGKALDSINQSIDDLKAITSKDNKKGLVLISTGGKLSAFGPGSRYGLVYDVFGVKPVDDQIKASTHGQKITYEYIAKKNPDYLFVVDRDQAIGGDTKASKVLDNDLVNGTKAAKSKHIVYLDPEIWYLSGGGLLSMEDMIKEVKAGIE
ncbi:siderophore ABC transporter substrate-binding protein [Pullulanibacillus pueri]|uniref:siderophore ABC transporter substrate-binding protein n=1 Tax=Pullulanibacillus pueri TaxID=1437324 RepID=UPI001668DC56|nr:siderophore ABC transporter substrate-binding protein [Pullulanibacillus pueri]